MIDQENFTRICKDLQEHVLSFTSSDVEQLVVSLMEMDQHLAIAQATLDFTLTTAEDLLKDVAEACVNVIGIRDHGKKRKLAQVAGEAAGRLAGAVQLYVAGQILQAQQAAAEALAVDNDEGDTVVEDATA